MDFSSALKGLLSGHKLRIRSWPEGNYIYFKDNKFEIHVEGCYDRPLTEFLINDILSTDWEIN